MAIYDGFFDAALNEETNEYDRAYDSGDFTGYFEQFIGSGVCVYNDPDSLLVRFRDGSAVVGPGYLFLQGYWLKNDGEYVVSLPGAGVYAIVARLDLGLRTIDVAAQAKAGPEDYPDALVLAYVTVDAAGAGQVEDTRHNTALCGVIDAAGSLSGKVEYAVNYIDTEIDGKLARAEAEIAAQAALLDGKIAEVGAQVEKLAPPPIGTVKFSASRDVGAEWLRCDGRFISEAEYPELVAALGKLTPGVEEFSAIPTDDVTNGISNMVLWNGFLWVYSVLSERLYRIAGTTGEIKEVHVTIPDNKLTDSTSFQLCLSIAGGYLFLSQTYYSGITVYQSGPFNVGISEITMEDKSSFINLYQSSQFSNDVIPYISCVNGTFRMAQVRRSSAMSYKIGQSEWTNESTLAKQNESIFGSESSTNEMMSLSSVFAFSWKNEGLLVRLEGYANNKVLSYTYVATTPGEHVGNIQFKTSAVDLNSQMCGSIPRYADGKLLFKVSVEDKSLVRVVFTPVSPPPQNLRIKSYTANISLPNAAKNFVESIDFVKSQNLWVCFVGTGFLFSRDPSKTNAWGYLDTTETMGIITRNGGAIYDDENQLLYLYGQDSANQVKLFKLRLTDWYHYANDGAWLPMIASDGVPAYIKAKEPAEGA